MKQEAQVVRSTSQVIYSYATIRLTRSRIDKGLIAVPIALAKWFPDHSTEIQIYLDDSSVSQSKRYSSGDSSTKECRIGGMKPWFEKNRLTSGDEIVVQMIDRRHSVYRLVPERQFLSATQRLQSDFDRAASEPEASGRLERLSQWTNTEQDHVVLNEYHRLAATSVPMGRASTERRPSRSRENTPASLRTLLGRLYQGHCQVCDFWFLKRNNEPYFEVHHLDANAGHHPKNLVVVCGNCHNQFEHADVVPGFTDDRWLTRVHFNGILHRVNQVSIPAQMPRFSKKLFL